jgi:hypothetical protein
MTAPFTAEDKRMLAYFWQDKGDPTRCATWDAARVQEHWPELWLVWTGYKSHERLLDLIFKDAGKDE